jgi:hypothetical protein
LMTTKPNPSMHLGREISPEPKPKFTPRERAGWKGDGDGFFEFTKEGLKEATEGFDFERVLDVLVDCGALSVGRDGRKSKPKKVGGRLTRVYPVDTSKL